MASQYRAPIPKGSREGYVSDLSPKERREMFAAHRRRRLSVATRRSKSFLKEHGPLIAVGTLAAVLLVFKKELRAKIGAVPQLTP